MRVYLSLGSNEGDRAAALRSAYERLRVLLGHSRASSIYETEPMYVLDQDRFLNAVCSGETLLPPMALLEAVQEIERSLGRIRKAPKGPRAIDVDILLYGDLSIREERLRVPHPGIRERPFVLVPLLELDPALRDPLTGTPYRVYLDSLGDAGVTYSQPLDT